MKIKYCQNMTSIKILLIFSYFILNIINFGISYINSTNLLIHLRIKDLDIFLFNLYQYLIYLINQILLYMYLV